MTAMKLGSLTHSNGHNFDLLLFKYGNEIEEDTWYRLRGRELRLAISIWLGGLQRFQVLSLASCRRSQEQERALPRLPEGCMRAVLSFCRIPSLDFRSHYQKLTRTLEHLKTDRRYQYDLSDQLLNMSEKARRRAKSSLDLIRDVA